MQERPRLNLGMSGGWRVWRVALALLLLITGWGASRTFASPSHTGMKASKLRFYYITPNPIGANEFLQLGEIGLKKAGQKYGAATKVLQASDPTTRAEDVNAALSGGASLVIVIGFEFNDIITRVAPQHPNVEFLIIDQCVTNPPKNVRCATFREYEDTYLLGVAAGKLTKSNKIGALGALDIPFLHRYTDAFAQGAKSVNPSVQVDIRWVASDTSGFADPAKAKEQTLAMVANGDDQILAAAAASNLGAFSAMKSKSGVFGYGVDVNQCPLARGHIVDNAVKKVDVVMLTSIAEILHKRGIQTPTYGVKSGAMTLTTLLAKKPKTTQCVLAQHQAVIKLIKQVRNKIISGKIKLKDPAKA